MDKFNVGIIGFGFLGSAMAHIFKLHADVKIYDKFKEGFDNLNDTIQHSEFLFICLPTPMFEDNGEIDLSIIDNMLAEISNSLPEHNDKIVIIKSTIIPGTTDNFAKKYPNLNIIHNPEFLTARKNLIDAITPARIILGGKAEFTSKVKELYEYRFGHSINIFETDSQSSELVKYSANIFFSMKVLFFNNIYDICEKLNLDYNNIKDMVAADGRIGNSHLDVPGHDVFMFNGQLQRGISGSCFAKDINALINYMKALGLDASMLEAAWNLNVNKYRQSKDWEKIPGVISKRKKC